MPPDKTSQSVDSANASCSRSVESSQAAVERKQLAEETKSSRGDEEAEVPQTAAALPQQYIKLLLTLSIPLEAAEVFAGENNFDIQQFVVDEDTLSMFISCREESGDQTSGVPAAAAFAEVPSTVDAELTERERKREREREIERERERVRKVKKERNRLAAQRWRLRKKMAAVKAEPETKKRRLCRAPPRADDDRCSKP